jgi:branched-subunit amino acid transport protein AzlD
VVGNPFMIIKHIRRNKMKKVLTLVVSILLLLTVACKSEAVEEAPAVEESVETLKEEVTE